MDTYGMDQPNKLLKTRVYYYRSDKAAWRHVSERKIAEQKYHSSSLTLVTWNVDYQTDLVKERMEGVLRHLQKYVFQGKDPAACCIMLQEVHPEGLKYILEDDWVRKHFAITPITPQKWPMCDYGNVTLVSLSVVVSRAAILTFAFSPMGRGAVLMDVKLNTAENGPREITLRVINTHLESLPQGAEFRPLQLQVLASLLKGKEEVMGRIVKGGIIAGDMNALEPKDATCVLDVGLQDAWTKPNLDPAGLTWGLQPECQYPPARFDKVLYYAPRKKKLFTVDEPRRIGVGIVPIDEYGVPLADHFVSDHYGLMTSLRVQGYQ